VKPNSPAIWLLLAALFAAPLAGCATPLPDTTSTDLTFALMGDTPYNDAEVRALDTLIDDLNAQDLAFVVHVGDITSGRGPCTDAWFEARQRQYQRLRHPLILLPGDNDWVDCHRSGFDPMERLDKMRRLFHSGDESIGLRTIRIERQSSNPRFAEYREHVRWVAGDVVFVGLNVQGSNNNLGRTPAMDEEHRQRMVAVLAWLEESMTLAAQRRLAGAVIFIQGNPDFEARTRRRAGVGDGHAAFREALRAHALRLGKPILFVHGDTHLYQQDQPLSDPSIGKPIANFVRVEVPGSPQVRWLKAGISRERSGVFAVTPAPPATALPY
jgi:predicted phosphodiesterase